jgi:hypothetical protein
VLGDPLIDLRRPHDNVASAPMREAETR